ncbi:MULTISPECIES: ABC transporter substrate-binding protein [Peribacillus]|uniref:ABC transporter substrate-binding protein n=1 Tax=Peribacillus TaxID=2675229 RepID=UPI00203EBCB4|nr:MULTISPECIES: ABC transporter substrate-binding protein [Peribacillus]MCM3676391.1 ABC transporter substrate-binding protein [Peribacillus simplex]MDQ0879282.1 ribose transport system substrate-binding protein [Peribacillus sp. V2I11]
MKTYLKSSFILIIMMFLVVLTACSVIDTGSNSQSNSAGSVEKNKSDQKLKIGLTLGTLSNPFFVSMSKGAKKATKEMGAELITVSADYDLAKQTSQIEDFITKEVDLILLNAVDSKGIAGAVQQAKSAGIPVIAVDVAAEGGVDSVVTSDNYQAGKIAGEYMIKQLKGKGNIAIIEGPPVSAVTDRINGFEEAIKKSEIKVIAKQNGEGNREKALSATENILQAHSNGSIDAIFAINDPEALGVKIAQEQAEREKEFFIVGVDGAPEAVEALKENKSFTATSAQHPDEMMKKALEIGKDVLDGKKVDKLVKVPVELVTQENVNNYKGW